MISILVKANVKGRKPAQMTKNLQTWNKHMDETNDKPTLNEKDLGLFRGLPFSYCMADLLYVGTSLIAIDLFEIDRKFIEIYTLNAELTDRTELVAVAEKRPFAVGAKFNHGFIALTPTRAKKLQFINDFVNAVDNKIAHGGSQILADIISAGNADQCKSIELLSKLIYNFQRDYFVNIPYLLEIVLDENDDGDYYLYSDEMAIESMIESTFDPNDTESDEYPQDEDETSEPCERVLEALNIAATELESIPSNGLNIASVIKGDTEVTMTNHT